MENGIRTLLTITSNKKGRELEAHIDSRRSIVTVVFTGIHEPEIGNIVSLRELLSLGELRDAIVASQDDGSVEICITSISEMIKMPMMNIFGDSLLSILRSEASRLMKSL